MNEFVDGAGGAFGPPGGVGSVAEGAAQVAAGRANEERPGARPRSFALDGFKDFGDVHGVIVLMRVHGPGDGGLFVAGAGR